MTNGVPEEALTRFICEVVNGREEMEPTAITDLKEELTHMVDTFNVCKLPVSRIKYIMSNGVSFEFGNNISVHMNCFQFARFLRFGRLLGRIVDANQLFNDIATGRTDQYSSLIKVFIASDKQTLESEAPSQPTAPAGPTPRV